MCLPVGEAIKGGSQGSCGSCPNFGADSATSAVSRANTAEEMHHRAQSEPSPGRRPKDQDRISSSILVLKGMQAAS